MDRTGRTCLTTLLTGIIALMMTDTNTALDQAIRQLAKDARAASRGMARASTEQKNHALLTLARLIREQAATLRAANERDLDAARKNGLDAAMLDRLTLSDKGLESMAEGVEQIASLPDPVGSITDMSTRPSGIQVGKMRVPLGVIGIIYEARPNVTADAAALCIKSGNATILRGGSEALNSNRAIAALVQQSLAEAGLPAQGVQCIDTTDRAAVGILITLRDDIDVIVPRGGKGLIERLIKESRVPMIKHLDGNCHVYVDDNADPEMALRIVENAKTQRYGTCNTTESLLIARSIAGSLLPRIGAMLQEKGVVVRGCAETQALLPFAEAATDEDWVSLVREQERRPFPFERGPLLRFYLLRGADSTDLIVIAPHVVCDGYSMTYAMAEVVALLNDPDREVAAPPPAPAGTPGTSTAGNARSQASSASTSWSLRCW